MVAESLERTVDPLTQLDLPDGLVDLPAAVVVRGDVRHSLTPKEVELLRFLALRAGQVVSRDTLLAEVWGYLPTLDTRCVEAAVHRVRRKIESDPRSPLRLCTVVGEGYRWSIAARSSLYAQETQRLLDHLERHRQVVVWAPVGIDARGVVDAAIARMGKAVVHVYEGPPRSTANGGLVVWIDDGPGVHGLPRVVLRPLERNRARQWFIERLVHHGLGVEAAEGLGEAADVLGGLPVWLDRYASAVASIGKPAPLEALPAVLHELRQERERTLKALPSALGVAMCALSWCRGGMTTEELARHGQVGVDVLEDLRQRAWLRICDGRWLVAAPWNLHLGPPPSWVPRLCAERRPFYVALSEAGRLHERWNTDRPDLVVALEHASVSETVEILRAMEVGDRSTGSFEAIDARLRALRLPVDVEPRVRCEVLEMRSSSLRRAGRLDEALDLAEEALEVAQELQDAERIGRCWYVQGVVRTQLRKPAWHCWEQVVAHLSEIEPELAHYALQCMAYLLLWDGEMEEAVSVSRRAHRLARTCSVRAQLRSSVELGRVLVTVGDHDEASARLTDVVREARRIRDVPFEAMALLTLAKADLDRGGVDRQGRLTQAVALLQQHPAAGVCRLFQGVDAWNRGERTAALAYLRQALRLLMDSRLGSTELLARAWLAVHAAESGEREVALRHLAVTRERAPFTTRAVHGLARQVVLGETGLLPERPERGLMYRLASRAWL